jgi:uroporphyrin-3 C-methyltransferase
MNDQTKDEPVPAEDPSPGADETPVADPVREPLSNNEPDKEPEPVPAEEPSPGADETPVADPVREPPSNNEPDKEPEPASSKRAAAWPGYIGLLVALLAAAGVGYLWQEQRTQKLLNQRFAGTQTELTNRGKELGRVSGDIEALNAADRKLDENIGALTKRIERQLEELPARMTRIEGTLDKIPGVAEGARSAWLLAEAEYFLRIANAQLILAGNVDVSLRALELADAKIKGIGDPGLTRVRAKISDERTALKAVPRPDTEGIALELGSIAQSLHLLPLSRKSPENFTSETDRGTETGWRRAWRVIVDALSSIISVRRSDETITPLMSAAEESLLIRSLDLELQIARLAVMRNEGSLYRQSLQVVYERLAQYFDVDSEPVRNTRATIERLAGTKMPDALPDISGSLSLLLNLGDEAAAP